MPRHRTPGRLHSTVMPVDRSPTRRDAKKFWRQDAYRQDFADLLVGQTIKTVDAENGLIELGDGTVLEVEDTAGCCAYFNATLRAINLDDNVVMSVTEHPLESSSPEATTLRVLTTDTRVAAEIDIEGDSTSGYYCHSVDLIVSGPGDGYTRS